MGSLSNADLEALYAWVDSIPLSKPRKHFARDFSDGVLVAEVVAHLQPKLVDVRWFSTSSQLSRKMYNWSTINTKVFRKLGFQLSNAEMEAICTCEAGAVEQVLRTLRVKLAKYAEQQKKERARESQRKEDARVHAYAKEMERQQRIELGAMQAVANIMNPAIDGAGVAGAQTGSKGGLEFSSKEGEPTSAYRSQSLTPRQFECGSVTPRHIERGSAGSREVRQARRATREGRQETGASAERQEREGVPRAATARGSENKAPGSAGWSDRLMQGTAASRAKKRRAGASTAAIEGSVEGTVPLAEEALENGAPVEMVTPRSQSARPRSAGKRDPGATGVPLTGPRPSSAGTRASARAPVVGRAPALATEKLAAKRAARRPATPAQDAGTPVQRTSRPSSPSGSPSKEAVACAADRSPTLSPATRRTASGRVTITGVDMVDPKPSSPTTAAARSARASMDAAAAAIAASAAARQSMDTVMAAAAAAAAADALPLPSVSPPGPRRPPVGHRRSPSSASQHGRSTSAVPASPTLPKGSQTGPPVGPVTGTLSSQGSMDKGDAKVDKVEALDSGDQGALAEALKLRLQETSAKLPQLEPYAAFSMDDFLDNLEPEVKAVLDRKDRTIQEQRETIEIHQTTIETVQYTIETQERTITELGRTIAEQQRLLKERDLKMTDLREQLQVAELKVVKLEDLLRLREARIMALETATSVRVAATADV